MKKILQKTAPMKPLKGMTVLVTRPVEQAQEIAAQITALGGNAHISPVIDISFRDNVEVDKVVSDLDIYAGVVLTSANAFRALQQAAERHGVTLSDKPTWYVISERTASVVRDYGLNPVVYPQVSTAADLVEAVKEAHLANQHAQFLFPKSAQATDTITVGLRDAGHVVTECVCYDTVEHHLSRDTWQKYLASERVAILLFSPSAVGSIVKQLGPAPLKRQTIYKIAVGPTTAAAIRSLDMEVAAVAQQPSADAVIDALVDVAKRR